MPADTPNSGETTQQAAWQGLRFVEIRGFSQRVSPAGDAMPMCPTAVSTLALPGG